MNRYEIKCTKEQTIKAISLGAPIKNVHYDNDGVYIYADNPTAEQMIGWLEEQDNLRFEVATGIARTWHYYIHIGYRNRYHNLFNIGYSTHKEATLAAIDAALDYLIEKKEE